jgi:hypothetical protein
VWPTPCNAAQSYQRSTSGAQHPALQDDRLAWPGVARLLTGKLKPKPARHNGHGLFLKMVQMHRRTDIRRSKEFAFQAIAVSITNDAEKSEDLAFAVLDLVRICVHQVPPILALQEAPGPVTLLFATSR